jgi:hypothetical protein
MIQRKTEEKLNNDIIFRELTKKPDKSGIVAYFFYQKTGANINLQNELKKKYIFTNAHQYQVKDDKRNNKNLVFEFFDVEKLCNLYLFYFSIY